MDDEVRAVLEDASSRVQDEPVEYIERGRELEDRYRFGEASDSEPIVALHKEIDGMARLLCALTANESIQVTNSELVEIYQQEVDYLDQFEDMLVAELPERERRER